MTVYTITTRPHDNEDTYTPSYASDGCSAARIAAAASFRGLTKRVVVLAS